jgi:hypothetical protein
VHITWAGLFTRAAQLAQKFLAERGGNPQEMHATAVGFIMVPQLVQYPPNDGVNDMSNSSRSPCTKEQAPKEGISAAGHGAVESLGADTQISSNFPFQ